MLKIIYVTKKSDSLEQFMNRQLSEANLESVNFSKINMEDEPELVEKYDIKTYHSILVFDKNDKLIDRIAGPFTAGELEKLIKYYESLVDLLGDGV